MERGDSVAELATNIIVAYLTQRDVNPEELPGFIRQIRWALSCDLEAVAGRAEVSLRSPTRADMAVRGLSRPESGVEEGQRENVGTSRTSQRPAVPVEESVRDDVIISLEDGKPYRSLRRHLMAKYGLTPDAYRQKWGLPVDYPMVAPSYARDRSAVARRIGLGRSGTAAKPKQSGTTISKSRAAPRGKSN